MKIASIHLKEFRGFRSLDLDFGVRLTIVTGVNGSGKTSLLDAISLNINHGVHRLTTNKDDGHFYPEHWLRANDVNYNSKVNEITGNYKIESKILSYTIIKNIFETGFKFDGDDFAKYFDKLKNIIELDTNLPLVVYYNSKKDFNLNKKREFNQRFPQIKAYVNSSNERTFTFSDFTSWFRNEEAKENELRLRQDSNYKLRNLEIVRKAILSIFNKLGTDNYTDLSIIRANPVKEADFNFSISEEGELFVKKNGSYLKIDQLSDGEKNILLTVADIASRIAQLNPSLEDPLNQAEGIVLFDEMELHLHPSWQRKVLPAFIHTFKSIQFIVTTHSENIVLSLLEEIKNTKIKAAECKVYFLKSEDNSIKAENQAENQELNEDGQIDGGLKNFYLDEISDTNNLFSLL